MASRDLSRLHEPKMRVGQTLGIEARTLDQAHLRSIPAMHVTPTSAPIYAGAVYASALPRLPEA
jgi:hypothetical protein